MSRPVEGEEEGTDAENLFRVLDQLPKSTGGADAAQQRHVIFGNIFRNHNVPWSWGRQEGEKLKLVPLYDTASYLLRQNDRGGIASCLRRNRLRMIACVMVALVDGGDVPLPSVASLAAGFDVDGVTTTSPQDRALTQAARLFFRAMASLGSIESPTVDHFRGMWDAATECDEAKWLYVRATAAMSCLYRPPEATEGKEGPSNAAMGPSASLVAVLKQAIPLSMRVLLETDADRYPGDGHSLQRTVLTAASDLLRRLVVRGPSAGPPATAVAPSQVMSVASVEPPPPTIPDAPETAFPKGMDAETAAPPPPVSVPSPDAAPIAKWRDIAKKAVPKVDSLDPDKVIEALYPIFGYADSMAAVHSALKSQPLFVDALVALSEAMELCGRASEAAKWLRDAMTCCAESNQLPLLKLMEAGCRGRGAGDVDYHLQQVSLELQTAVAQPGRCPRYPRWMAYHYESQLLCAHPPARADLPDMQSDLANSLAAARDLLRQSPTSRVLAADVVILGRIKLRVEMGLEKSFPFARLIEHVNAIDANKWASACPMEAGLAYLMLAEGCKASTQLEHQIKGDSYMKRGLASLPAGEILGRRRADERQKKAAGTSEPLPPPAPSTSAGYKAFAMVPTVVPTGGDAAPPATRPQQAPQQTSTVAVEFEAMLERSPVDALQSILDASSSASIIASGNVPLLIHVVEALDAAGMPDQAMRFLDPPAESPASAALRSAGAADANRLELCRQLIQGRRTGTMLNATRSLPEKTLADVRNTDPELSTRWELHKLSAELQGASGSSVALELYQRLGTLVIADDGGRGFRTSSLALQKCCLMARTLKLLGSPWRVPHLLTAEKAAQMAGLQTTRDPVVVRTPFQAMAAGCFGEALAANGQGHRGRAWVAAAVAALPRMSPDAKLLSGLLLEAAAHPAQKQRDSLVDLCGRAAPSEAVAGELLRLLSGPGMSHREQVRLAVEIGVDLFALSHALIADHRQSRPSATLADITRLDSALEVVNDVLKNHAPAAGDDATRVAHASAAVVTAAIATAAASQARHPQCVQLITPDVLAQIWETGYHGRYCRVALAKLTSQREVAGQALDVQQMRALRDDVGRLAGFTDGDGDTNTKPGDPVAHGISLYDSSYALSFDRTLMSTCRDVAKRFLDTLPKA